MMRIGYVQNDPVFGEPDANLRAVETAMRQTRADLWILPELFASGYLFGDRTESARLAEPVPDGPTVQGLLRIARERACAIVAGLPERSGGRVHNTAVAVDPSGVRAVYRKVHLFNREKEWFDPGDTPFPVVELAGARVGIMICWDWRFPEVARTLALGGAQLIAHPSNLVLPHCQAAMVTRALENRVFVATVNRIGRENRGGSDLTFTGGTRIVSPDGEVLRDAPASAVSVDFVEIDPGLADSKRATPGNDLFRDRRPEFYRL
jgi:5-aminopentanamidase